MRAWARYGRLLPLPGLAVMVAAGVTAQRYAPDWFDVGDTCQGRRTRCFSEEESASVLRSSAWMGWAGLLLMLLGVGLCAWAQSSTHRSTPSGRGAAVHAGVSGLLAGPAAVIGLVLGWVGAFIGLGWALIVIAWLTLAAVLEALDVSLGRERSDRAAFLLSLQTALVAPVVLSGLGLLEPPKVWAPGTWSHVEAYLHPPAATPPSVPDPTTIPTPFRTATPGRSPTSVSARRPCSPGDLTLVVGEFDFAMGVGTAAIRASNRSGSACYLDGFATVTLTQGGKPLDLKIGTTSSESPGSGIDGHATRVGIAPGNAARLLMYRRDYSKAADTKTPQTLELLLRPGVAAVPLSVPAPLFDLIDGDELQVGNWRPST